MLDIVAVDGLVFGVACVAAGIAVLRPRPPRWTGLGLVFGGAALVVAGAIWTTAPDAAMRIALVAAFVPFTLAVIVYPDGRLPGVAGPLAAAVGGLAAIGLLIRPRDGAIQFAAVTVVGVAIALCLWWRFEHSSALERSPLLWFVTATVVVLLVLGHLVFIAANLGGGIAGLIVSLLVPASVVVGLRWPAVLDVRTVMARSVLYGIVAITAIAVFVAELEVLRLAGVRHISDGTLGLLAVPVAAGFHPVAVMLRGIIDRLLFGDRADPVTAAAHVGRRLGDDPVLALRALREALALPYAQLTRGGEVVAVSGKPSTVTRELPLVVGTVEAGALTVGLRPGELSLSAADDRVLRTLTPALAQAAHAHGLADALAESRERAVAAIEEERRRLHRDLHDGLGPTLTGVAYSADAARNLLRSDPDEASVLLTRLRADTGNAIAEVRRVVQGLRPPALDELGLVHALHQRAAATLGIDGDPLAVQVRAAELPPLPAGVEVAAYRIAVEAVTNAARHARCSNVQVDLRVEDHVLLIDVTDDGPNHPAEGGWAVGSGTESMRERAAQLGGTLIAGPTPHGGRVQAALPIPVG